MTEDFVECTECGAANWVEDGEAWAENHAHPHSVTIEKEAL